MMGFDTKAGWRVLGHALLAVLVLLAQHGAWRHHLSHGVPTQATGAQTAATGQAAESLDAPCLQCLAYAAMADVAHSPVPDGPALALAHACAAAAAHTPHLASARLAYQSRAPPQA
jgi:hypothetical protein